MEDGVVKIKVKPTGKMVMIQVDILAKQINYIHLPEDVRYGEGLRRAKILAVGPDCTSFKPGDTIYFAIGANCVEVEHFYRAKIGEAEGGQVYLVYEDNIPAKYEIVGDNEEVGLDVVSGLSTEAHRLAQQIAVDAGNVPSNAQSPRIYRPRHG